MYAQLPPHPFLTFWQIFAGIAKSNIPGAVRRHLFLLLCKIWIVFAHVGKGEARIKAAFARGEDGFLVKVRRFRARFQPEISATFILDTAAPEEPARRAAKLVVGALRFRQRVLGDQLAQDYEGSRPLDMQRYRNIFSRLTLLSLHKGAPECEVVDAPPSTHIIVAVDGIFYKLQVLQDEHIVAVAVLYQQLGAIVADARRQLDDIAANKFPFGVLTAMQNKQSIALANKLQAAHPETFTALHTALFVLALDIHNEPQSLDEACRATLADNFHNRDYRHSLQLIVSGSSASLLLDPEAGVGGTHAAQFAQAITSDAVLLESELASPAAAPTPSLYQPLAFPPELLTTEQDTLVALQKDITVHLYNAGMSSVYRLDGIGKDDFVTCGISADAAFHAALHLAFARSFGKLPNIANSISLRSFQHGNIWRYNSTTVAMLDFVKNPTAERAHAAAAEHKAQIKSIKSGTAEFYHGEMMLRSMLRNRELGPFAMLTLMMLMRLFIKDFKRRFISPDLWVSHIPEFGGVAMTGRGSVKLSHRSRPSLAGHYMLFAKHMVVCFVSNPGKVSYCGRERQFAATLQTCLVEIKQTLGRAQAQAQLQGGVSASRGADLGPVMQPGLG